MAGELTIEQNADGSATINFPGGGSHTVQPSGNVTAVDALKQAYGDRIGDVAPPRPNPSSPSSSSSSSGTPAWVGSDYSYTPGQKPNNRQLMEAMGGKPLEDMSEEERSRLSSISTSLLYGVVGSNQDTRNWDKIMEAGIDPATGEYSEERIQTAAGIATAQMYDGVNVVYESGGYEKDDDGNTILDSNGKPKELPPYLYLKGGNGTVLRGLSGNAESMARAMRDFGVRDTSWIDSVKQAMNGNMTTLAPQVKESYFTAFDALANTYNPWEKYNDFWDMEFTSGVTPFQNPFKIVTGQGSTTTTPSGGGGDTTTSETETGQTITSPEAETVEEATSDVVTPTYEEAPQAETVQTPTQPTYTPIPGQTVTTQPTMPTTGVYPQTNVTGTMAAPLQSAGLSAVPQTITTGTNYTGTNMANLTSQSQGGAGGVKTYRNQFGQEIQVTVDASGNPITYVPPGYTAVAKGGLMTGYSQGGLESDPVKSSEDIYLKIAQKVMNFQGNSSDLKKAMAASPAMAAKLGSLTDALMNMSSTRMGAAEGTVAGTIGPEQFKQMQKDVVTQTMTGPRQAAVTQMTPQAADMIATTAGQAPGQASMAQAATVGSVQQAQMPMMPQGTTYGGGTVGQPRPMVLPGGQPDPRVVAQRRAALDMQGVQSQPTDPAYFENLRSIREQLTPPDMNDPAVREKIERDGFPTPPPPEMAEPLPTQQQFEDPRVAMSRMSPEEREAELRRMGGIIDDTGMLEAGIDARRSLLPDQVYPVPDFDLPSRPGVPTQPPGQAASTVRATTATPAVQQETARLQAQQGTVSDQAQVAAQQQTESAITGMQAAQGEAFLMENPVQREIQEGELISGAADAEKAAKFTEQIEAATATPSEKATVQGQLEGLMQQFEGGETPAWAAGSMRSAMSTLAARGLSASSMAGQAVIQAAMEAALPIAQQDAQTQAQFESQNLSNRQQRAMLAAQQRAQFLGQEFDQAFQARVQNSARIGDIANMNFTAEQNIALENSRAVNTMNLQNLSNRQAMVMAEAAALSNLDMANLNNRQQAAVQNAQSFLQMDMANLNNAQQTSMFKAQQNIQALFTDQAAENAAAQFNATSENQTNQFFASLSSQTSQFNASQANAMEQFNVNSVNALRQFNAEVQNQRTMFNAQNGLVVAQANAQWRQNIATMNTAAINESNMEFARTMNELTATNLDEIWQRERDLLSMAFKVSESNADRANEVLLQKIAAQASKDAANLQADLEAEKNTGDFIKELLIGISGWT